MPDPLVTDLPERLASLDDVTFFRLMHELAAAVERLRKAGLTTLELCDFITQAMQHIGRRA